jgi:hypothetical protein
MVRVLWADQDLNYVRVRFRKAWTPRVGQIVEVLVVSYPLFLVSEHGSVFTTLVEPMQI